MKPTNQKGRMRGKDKNRDRKNRSGGERREERDTERIVGDRERERLI